MGKDRALTYYIKFKLHRHFHFSKTCPSHLFHSRLLLFHSHYGFDAIASVVSLLTCLEFPHISLSIGIKKQRAFQNVAVRTPCFLMDTHQGWGRISRCLGIFSSLYYCVGFLLTISQEKVLPSESAVIIFTKCFVAPVMSSLYNYRLNVLSPWIISKVDKI